MWLKNRVNRAQKEARDWKTMALGRRVSGMASEMRLGPKCSYEWKDNEDAKKQFAIGVLGCKRCWRSPGGAQANGVRTQNDQRALG